MAFLPNFLRCSLTLAIGATQCLDSIQPAACLRSGSITRAVAESYSREALNVSPPLSPHRVRPEDLPLREQLQQTIFQALEIHIDGDSQFQPSVRAILQ